MKNNILKLLTLILIMLFITSCNKWYDDNKEFETILTSGVWKMEQHFYNPKPNQPEIEHQNADDDYYRVFKPNGTVCIYHYWVSSYLEEWMDSTDLILIKHENLEGEIEIKTIYRLLDYGTWWVEDNQLIIRNDIFFRDIHKWDYGYIQLKYIMFYLF